MANISRIFIAILFFVISFTTAEFPKYQVFNDGKMHLYFLDVGQGDASLVKLPSQKLILIDGGPSNSTEGLVSDNIPFWINKIDLLVISHSHADHIVGLIDILQNYNIGCVVYDSDDNSDSETETQLRDLIKSKNIHAVSTLDIDNQMGIQSDCFSDNDIKLQIYSLRNENKLDGIDIKKNQNLESNIVLLKYKKFDVLYTGDAENPVQEGLLDSLHGDIEVIKVPHHGGADSYDPDLLAKLKPDLAVISDGTNNRYGHPHKETLEGYDSFAIKVLRTDLNGQINIETDGLKYSYTLEKP